MAMASMNLIGVFVTKLWPVQALACGGGGGDGGDGGGTKTIISPKFSNFGDIINSNKYRYTEATCQGKQYTCSDCDWSHAQYFRTFLKICFSCE